MIKKLVSTVCLLLFLVSTTGCGVGHGTTVKVGDKKEKKRHQKIAQNDPSSVVGLGKPDE